MGFGLGVETEFKNGLPAIPCNSDMALAASCTVGKAAWQLFLGSQVRNPGFPPRNVVVLSEHLRTGKIESPTGL